MIKNIKEYHKECIDLINLLKESLPEELDNKVFVDTFLGMIVQAMYDGSNREKCLEYIKEFFIISADALDHINNKGKI